MNSTPSSADCTRDQVDDYSKFWDSKQIKNMISEVDKRDPKSSTTLDCIKLLTDMTLNDHPIDPLKVFAIMCVLNKGPIFSTVDPHIDITETPKSTVQKPAGVFKMHNIDEELMKLLSD
jgi:hypothetical protein